MNKRYVFGIVGGFMACALAGAQNEKSFRKPIIAADSSESGTTFAVLARLQAGGFKKTVSLAVGAAAHRAEVFE